jgi:glycosyltransferase involved in cell wall biosynthesis
MIEKENIQATLGSKVKVWVIQNLPGTLCIKPFPYKKSGAIILCTVALVSKMKNHLLVIESLMKCQAEVVYHIYGPIKDNDYWQTCSKAIAKLPVNISVTYHGIISPDHICDAIADAHVYIQPSKSENYSHSLVDAFMTGRPVITSYFTPWNNLAVEYAGANVSIDCTKEITKAIDQFAAMDATELQQWSKGASEYVSKAMDVETIKKQYIDMFTAKPFN